VVLYGLVLVHQRLFPGLIFSLVLCAGGIFAFSIHTCFLKLGRKEFDTLLSRAMLWSALTLSVAQLAVTI